MGDAFNTKLSSAQRDQVLALTRQLDGASVDSDGKTEIEDYLVTEVGAAYKAVNTNLPLKRLLNMGVMKSISALQSYEDVTGVGALLVFRTKDVEEMATSADACLFLFESTKNLSWRSRPTTELIDESALPVAELGVVRIGGPKVEVSFYTMKNGRSVKSEPFNNGLNISAFWMTGEDVERAAPALFWLA